MSTKVKCVVCNQEVDIRGIKLHMLQLHQITGKETNISTLEDPAKLRDEISTKTTELAQLNDSIKAKDAEIVTLNGKVAELSDPERINNLIRYRFENMTKDEYQVIHKFGLSRGFIDAPHPQPLPAGTVEDSTQDRAEAAHLAHNQEVVGSSPAPATTETAPVADTGAELTPIPPVHEVQYYIGKKEGDGWEYREFLGLSVKY